MFDDCPVCHRKLSGARTLIGWSPCICEQAWCEHKGHRTLQCWECWQDGWTTVRYAPYHPHQGGHPNR